MKLNKTYRLVDMLNALTAASTNLKELRVAMSATNTREATFIQYEPVNMLTSSPFARVTLTEMLDDNTWAGYMETSLQPHGPKPAVKVIRQHGKIVANSTFTQFDITYDNCPEMNMTITTSRK